MVSAAASAAAYGPAAYAAEASPEPEEVEDPVEEEEVEEEEVEEEVEEEAAAGQAEVDAEGEPLEAAAHAAETVQDNSASAADRAEAGGQVNKWPGWPGDSVFRLIVPVLKVGSIIGRKGDLIKKLCEETRARVRILDGPVGTTDRVVLISGKEEPEEEISPAMEAVLRVFKRVNGITEADGKTPASGAPAVCGARLLVAAAQAINLIGKQGASIKLIQENTGATIRIISPDGRPFYVTQDERIVEIQGDTPKVLKALEAIVGHLRKFLVDHSVLPLFEKTYNSTVTQDRATESAAIHSAPPPAVGSDYPLPAKQDSSFLDREPLFDPQVSRTGLSLYGRDPALSSLRSSGHGRPAGALVTQITQTMQVPLPYAEDIIGVGGGNISYIRATSGAVITVQETRGAPDEITVEIKGTVSQVQAAQQLVQDFMEGHKETGRSSYGSLDPGYRSSYSEYGGSAYPSSSLASSYSLGGYGSSGFGGGYTSSYRY